MASILTQLQFTYTEKIAFVQCIEIVIHADKKVTHGEVSFMQDMYDRIRFTKDAQEDLRTIDPDFAVKVVAKMSLPKRMALALAVCQMAMADYNLSTKEIKFIDDVMKVLGLRDFIPTEAHVPTHAPTPRPSAN